MQCVVLPTGHHYARLLRVRLGENTGYAGNIHPNVKVSDFSPNGAYSVRLSFLPHELLPLPYTFISNHIALSPVNRSSQAHWNIPWNGNILVACHNTTNKDGFCDITQETGQFAVLIAAWWVHHSQVRCEYRLTLWFNSWIHGLIRKGLFGPSVIVDMPTYTPHTQ